MPSVPTAANGAAAAAPSKVAGASAAAAAPAAEFVDPTEHYSDLQRARLDYVPPKPVVLQGTFTVVDTPSTDALPYGPEADAIRAHFPHTWGKPPVRLVRAPPAHGVPADGSSHPLGDPCRTQLRVGIVLSGGQAPGGHNVIGGVLDALMHRHPGSRLFGFLDGPRGILERNYKEITVETMLAFRNQGGFHLICSGRDKIEKPADLARAAATASELDLDGLVVCGGDDSNTNAAVLAEYFAAQGLKTCVVGVPKTIDGDLKNERVATSFGFDTACKVYAEAIGNIMVDAASAKKYYHFIRLMGRAASHVTLECALQTHPQEAIICEEVDALGMTLADVTNRLADIVAARAAAGKHYGVVLLPEGLIEHVPQMRALISELNDLLADGAEAGDEAAVAARLGPESAAVFAMLPPSIRAELLLERDPHGNVQVSRIETEKLIQKLVEAELAARKAAGTYSGKFACLTHFLGYEGRCSLPTNFDATYCAALGYAAGALIMHGKSGLMATCEGLARPTAAWDVGGYPLTGMMAIERRHGKDKPVIRKALVDLHGPAFRELAARRATWALHDCFRSPGPIQFSGVGGSQANMTLALELNGGVPVCIR